MSPFSTRSSNGSSVTKMAPALGALVKVAPSKPAKPAVWATPSTESARLATSRTTASVRVERGAGRQLDGGDQVALVLLGDEAGGCALELAAGEPDQADIDDQHQPRQADQPARSAPP